MRTLRGWVRVALTDLRGDLRRFGILLACLALGVGTIAIVGSVGAALQTALLRDARVLLGGDLEAQLSYRRANPDELSFFAGIGRTAEVIEVMGRASSDEDSAFVSLRAVDSDYPLVGTAEIGEASPAGAPLSQLLATTGGVPGAVVDALLLDRLHLAIGDTVKIGTAEFAIRGTIAHLPDSLSSSLQFGIPVLLSVEGLDQTGILAPGVLARYRYKIALDGGGSFSDAAAQIRARFPDAGWQINAPSDATADLSRFFDLFGRFLVIVGLSSLLIGGVGVSNAISAYVTDRQRSIATLKALGATSGRIMFHFLFQVLLLSAVGILLGLVLGYLLSLVALPLLGGLLGLDLPPVIDAGSLLIAAGFGALTAFAFGFAPLRRTQKLRPALLFRSAGSAIEGGLGWRDAIHPAFWVPLVIAGFGIYQLAILSTGRQSIVDWYFIGAAVAFVILRVAAFLLQMGLRLLPNLPNAFFRNALKAIYRPGAPAPTVILSLGLGLSLLLMIALLDGNLRHQLDRETIPNAPSFVFMDLFEDEADDIKTWSADRSAVEDFTAVPMLRGSIKSINGVSTKDIQPPPPPEFGFLLEDEVPLTLSAELPELSTVTEGAWWPADYDGEPQVSVFEKIKSALNLKLGDTITFLVSGEEVTAKISNFRSYVWRNGSVNFGFVFSPNAFADFPVSYLGLMKVTTGTERDTQRDLVAAFPDVIFLPVSEALATFATILASVTGAVEAIGGLAVVSGCLVLAGAMIAGRRQREADAVVMKVLGATRGDVIRAYLVEYGLLGLLAALLAAVLGVFGTWAFVTYVLELDFWVDPLLIVWVTSATVALTILVGTAVTWSALSIKPARFLREEG